MSAGKGSQRRKGSDDKKHRENFAFIKGFENSPDIDKRFEEVFMSKQASDSNAGTGKYFIDQ